MLMAAGSRWHLAMELLHLMRAAEILMDVISCGSVMSALEQGGKEAVQEVLEPGWEDFCPE